MLIGQTKRMSTWLILNLEGSINLIVVALYMLEENYKVDNVKLMNSHLQLNCYGNS